MFMDTEIWGDSENFRPERFINSDGTLNKELGKRILAFGVGMYFCRLKYSLKTIYKVFINAKNYLSSHITAKHSLDFRSLVLGV